MANGNSNSNSSNTAGASLLAGSDFEISWVIRGTEWSQGRAPTGWQALASPIASGSGTTGQAAQALVAIQQSISTKADQTYVLRLQINQAIASGNVLEVAWGDETIAVIKGEQVKPPQSLQLLLPGVDGSRTLRLSTNRNSDFGSVNGLGLFAQPIEKPTPVDIGVTAKEGQVLRANTTQLKDADGLGALNYQWQSKSADGKSWNELSGSNNAEARRTHKD